MYDRNLIEKLGIPLSIIDAFDSMSERSFFDAIVMVDSYARILLIGPTTTPSNNFPFGYHQSFGLTLEDISHQKVLGEELLGANYYETFFGLNMENLSDQNIAKRTPLYMALETVKQGEVWTNSTSPYPTLSIKNDAYQVETRVVKFPVSNIEVCVVHELWRRLGLPGKAEVFKGPSFIKIT